MPSLRVLTVILFMGAAAIAAKLLDLWEWHVNRRPIMDTAGNGGVKTTAVEAGLSGESFGIRIDR